MTPTSTIARAGLERAWVEFRRGFTTLTDGGFYVGLGIAVFAILWVNRDQSVEGIDGLTFSAVALPSIIGGLIGFLSILGIAYSLATEREDGTLLRARSLPHGMPSYFVGQVGRTTLETIAGLAIAVVPALLVIDDLFVGDPLGLLWLPGLLLLGLLATLPIGVLIGVLVRGVKSVNTWGSLPLFFLVWVSGILVPTIALPGWARAIGQVFPLYWLGLGTRAALLPDEAAAIEIGGSWRPGLTVVMLVAWAVVGTLVAIPVLRRKAARESGSLLAQRRERALQRTA